MSIDRSNAPMTTNVQNNYKNTLSNPSKNGDILLNKSVGN